MPTKHNPPRPKEGELTKRGKPAGKSGKRHAVPLERLETVASLMLQMSSMEMEIELAARYDVTRRTIRNYRATVIREMGLQLEEAGFLKPDIERVLASQQIEAARAAAHKAGDFRGEARLIELRCKLVGLMGGNMIKVQLPQVAPSAKPDEVNRAPRAQVGIIILPAEIALPGAG